MRIKQLVVVEARRGGEVDALMTPSASLGNDDRLKSELDVGADELNSHGKPLF